MKTSESIKNIAGGLITFHSEVGKISPSANNPFFKSRYAPLSEILSAIKAPLQKAGLVVVQFPTGENELTTRLIHSSGEWMESTYKMTPTKADPQGQGSVITYMRRYAIGAILSLNIDEDDDANTAAGKQNGQAKTAPKQKPKISEKQFRAALARIDKGEKGVVEKLIATFDLEPEQLHEIQN